MRIFLFEEQPGEPKYGLEVRFQILRVDPGGNEKNEDVYLGACYAALVFLDQEICEIIFQLENFF